MMEDDRLGLARPVDAASLAIFRIAFGAIMLWEVVRYFQHDWIQQYYVTPSFHFTYYGFGWVRPWSGPGMHLHFLLLGTAAAAIAVGWRYRAAAAIFFIGFAYVFLLEQARYLNHFYLICLLALVLFFVPAHQILSVDARRGQGVTTVPAWALWLVRFQVGIPYVFAGVAKLNPDWLRGEPLRAWMAARSDMALLGPLLTSEPVVLLFAYGAILLDLAVVPLLLWRRTRPAAYVTVCVFHLLNVLLFSIGVFPFLMIAATTIFFAPDWPRRFVRRWTGLELRPQADRPYRAAPAAVALLAAYAAIQVLVPLRHLAYPGDVAWTEEGHRFAWRMKLRDKSGEARFIVADRETGETREVDWRRHLARWQYGEMVGRPDMILQFAHYLAREEARETGRTPAVHAVVQVSLNGANRARLVEPCVDLAAEPRTLGPARWIAGRRLG